MKSLKILDYLQQPIELRGVRFKNRMMVGPMSLGLFNDDLTFSRIQKFYQTLCENSVSSITMGGFSPDRDGCYRQSDDSFFDIRPEQFQILNQMLQKYEVVSFCQLLHVGQFAIHDHPVGASGMKAPLTGIKARALSSGEIHNLIARFSDAAKRASELGFSGIELNAAEGFLLHQFNSSQMNQRLDEWGGSPQKNIQFLKMIISDVRKVVPDHFLISIRFGVDSFESKDTAETLGLINALDVDLVTPVFGQINDIISKNNSMVPEGFFLKFYERLRYSIQKPLVAHQKITKIETLQKSTSDHFDFVSMARPYLADPAIVKKSFDGVAESVNQCLGCNQLCINRTFQMSKNPAAISCLINPFLNFDFINAQTNGAGKVAVIGGGILGLQAAYALSQGGYAVKLFEISNELGGLFGKLLNVPTKKIYRQAVQFYVSEIKKRGVEVVLNHEVSLESLSSFQVIFNASNSLSKKELQFQMPILDYRDVLKDPAKIQNCIVIIGGGGVGLEIAEFCHIQDETTLDKVYTKIYKDSVGLVKLPGHKKIYILERKKGLLGHGLPAAVAKEKRHLLALLGVQLVDAVQAIVVQTGHVSYSRGDQDVVINDVDTIIDCTGITRNSLAKEIVEDQRTIDLYSTNPEIARSLESSQEILIHALLKMGAIRHASNEL